MLSQHRYTKIMLFLPNNVNFPNNVVISIYLNCWNWHFRCSVFRPIMVSYYGFAGTLETWYDTSAVKRKYVDLFYILFYYCLSLLRVFLKIYSIANEKFVQILLLDAQGELYDLTNIWTCIKICFYRCVKNISGIYIFGVVKIRIIMLDLKSKLENDRWPVAAMLA